MRVAKADLFITEFTNLFVIVDRWSWVVDRSSINDQPPTINRQPSTVNRQPSTANRQPSTVNRQPRISYLSPLSQTSHAWKYSHYR